MYAGSLAKVGITTVKYANHDGTTAQKVHLIRNMQKKHFVAFKRDESHPLMKSSL